MTRRKHERSRLPAKQPKRWTFLARFVPRGRTVRDAMESANVIDLSAYRQRRQAQYPRPAS